MHSTAEVFRSRLEGRTVLAQALFHMPLSFKSDLVTEKLPHLFRDGAGPLCTSPGGQGGVEYVLI